jgi:hypothetical protein
MHSLHNVNKIGSGPGSRTGFDKVNKYSGSGTTTLLPHCPQRAGLPLHILAELGSQMLCCAFPSARPASIKGTVA